MKKDDIVTVKIEDLSSDGLGVGRSGGIPLFVKDTVIGDTAEVKVMKMKKTYGYARLMRLLIASPDRVSPVCPVARQCGGCQLQAMNYEAQLRFKERKVKNSLERIGKLTDVPMEPIIGMEEPFRYRNKAQFPVGRDREGRLISGFYAGRTHDIVSCDDCLLGAEVNREILNIVLSHMERYHIPPYDETTGEGLVRHIMTRTGRRSGQLMVCIVINGDRLPESGILAEALSAVPGITSLTLSVNRERTNVIMGRELILLWGRDCIEDQIGDVYFHISPLSFYQVNPVQTERLYGKALEYAGLTGSETVWDLYCGIGTISLFLARRAKQVYGVEIVPAAIDDARRNARRNGIANAKFYVGRAEDVLPEKYEKEGISADVIVVDPPRKGCEESVLATMAQMSPARIVYVSCDPATLARDLKYLCQNGYRVERVCPVDMFPQSVHVETVCLLSNRKSKPDTHVDLTLDMEDYYRIKDQEKQSNK